MIFNSPVYPIPPSFKSGELELQSTQKYLEYLKEHGAQHVMTTAGTSQFNLLSIEEVRELNSEVLNFSGNKIIGLPALSTPLIKKEIHFLNERKADNTYLLIIFPERYYTDSQVVNFFREISKYSSYPILGHTTPVRKGNGGNYSYSQDLLKSLSNIDGFLGVKEESPSLDFASNSIQDLDLEIIVAGGSMKRFWALNPFGATTFLSGVGSLFPFFDERFFTLYSGSDPKEAMSIIKNVETPFFNSFMNIGWHASMRFGLNQLGLLEGNRSPFITLCDKEKETIKSAISQLPLP